MTKTLEHRINRIVGQLESLKSELGKSEYDCEYVISQLKVVVGSVKSLTKAVAEDDIQKCFDKKTPKEETKKHLSQILETAFK